MLGIEHAHEIDRSICWCWRQLTWSSLSGHEVIWAGNHDEYAIEAHKQNHPQAMHICEDLIGYNYHTVRHDVLMSSSVPRPCEQVSPGEGGIMSDCVQQHGLLSNV